MATFGAMSARRWEGARALVPLSWLYAGGVAVVRGLRRAPSPTAARPRVVSVGNLEVGGSGKTPLCIWLLDQAGRAGRRAVYASRGFGSEAERAPLVTLVPGRGAPAPASFAGLRVLAREALDLAASVGDEGALVARRVPAASLVFARDKRRAVDAAARDGADLVVVDDAFQSFALARHLDVLLLDAREPVANGRVLPAGRLREPPAAMARADVIVFNGARDLAAVEAARARVARWLRPNQRVYGLRRDVTLVPATPEASATPTEALAVAGIARPADFRGSVEACRVGVADAMDFPDHHRYTGADVRELRRRAGRRAIVTTEKDWVKLARFEWGDTAVWVARLDVDLVGLEETAAWFPG